MKLLSSILVLLSICLNFVDLRSLYLILLYFISLLGFFLFLLNWNRCLKFIVGTGFAPFIFTFYIISFLQHLFIDSGPLLLFSLPSHIYLSYFIASQSQSFRNALSRLIFILFIIISFLFCFDSSVIQWLGYASHNNFSFQVIFLLFLKIILDNFSVHPSLLFCSISTVIFSLASLSISSIVISIITCIALFTSFLFAPSFKSVHIGRFIKLRLFSSFALLIPLPLFLSFLLCALFICFVQYSPQLEAYLSNIYDYIFNVDLLYKITHFNFNGFLVMPRYLIINDYFSGISLVDFVFGRGLSSLDFLPFGDSLHNSFLLIHARSGFIPIVLLFTSTIAASRRMLKAKHSPSYFPILLLFLLLGRSFFDTYLFSVQPYTIVFFLLISTSSGFSQLSKTNQV